MSTITLRPNSTVSNTGALTGASAHAALSDDSDSTFIVYNNSQSTTVALADLTLPAGAVPKSIAMRARSQRTSGTGTATLASFTGSGLMSGSVNVTWLVPTITTLATHAGADITDAVVDAETVQVQMFAATAHIAIYEVYYDVIYVNKPSVAVNAPVANTATPVISWVNTYDADGLAPAYFEVKVFTDAQYLAGGWSTSDTPFVGSGVTTSTDNTWTVSPGLPNDTYRAYVRAGQLVNGSPHYSDWQFTQFTINNAVVPPTFDVTPQTSRLLLTTQTDPFGQPCTVTIERSYDNVAWSPFTGFGVLNTAPVLRYDYETPGNVRAYFRAKVQVDFGGGIVLTSGWATDDGQWTDALFIRKYKLGDPGSVSGGPEIINSIPVPRPPVNVVFDVTPHGPIVTFATTFGTYDYPAVGSKPAMYTHDVGIVLTFTATRRPDEIPRNIIEYYWDFGDGTSAVGPTVTKTYHVANPGVVVHLRVTEDTGQRGYASMNLMLNPPA